MSSIHGVGGGNPVQKVVNQPVIRTTESAAAEAGATRAKDRLELSGMSHLLAALKSDGGVRADKVAQIKAQIEANAYEDDAKLEAAVDKLLDEINRE